MKNIIITSIFICVLSISSQAQFRFDVYGGYAPAARPATAGLIVNRHSPHEEFVFNMTKVDPQYHVGVKGHLPLNEQFFVEAGVGYTMRKSTYHVQYTLTDAEHPVSDHYMNESQHLLLLPVNLGVNLGSVDITSGLRLQTGISGSSQLEQINGFTSSPQGLNLGWQGGAGFYILNTRIGIEYQSSFSRVGSGMSVNGQSLELMNIPGQVIFNIQQSF